MLIEEKSNLVRGFYGTLHKLMLKKIKNKQCKVICFMNKCLAAACTSAVSVGMLITSAMLSHLYTIKSWSVCTKLLGWGVGGCMCDCLGRGVNVLTPENSYYYHRRSELYFE